MTLPAPLRRTSSGNVLVTGYSPGVGSACRYVTMAYSSAGLPYGPIVITDRGTGMMAGRSGGGWQWQRLRGGVFRVVPARIMRPLRIQARAWPCGQTVTTARQVLERARAVAVDSSGLVFVSGYSLDSFNAYDYATIAYSSTGAPMWTNRYDASGNEARTPS